MPASTKATSELQALVKARDCLSEVAAVFNEIVVSRMVPYFSAGCCNSVASAFYFRRTAGSEGLRYFDSVYLKVASQLLLKSGPNTDFARRMSIVRCFKVSRNQFIHRLCGHEEATQALSILLKDEPVVSKREDIRAAFSLIINSICSDTEEQEEMSFSDTFVLPMLGFSPLRDADVEFVFI
jgi:hypothetical protein